MYPIVGADGGAAIAGLLTPAGRELLDLLAGEAVSPDRALALSASLRTRYPPDLVAAALTQQALRAAAAENGHGRLGRSPAWRCRPGDQGPPSSCPDRRGAPRRSRPSLSPSGTRTWTARAPRRGCA